jgi:glucose-1-phosphate adenylyltransferase
MDLLVQDPPLDLNDPFWRIYTRSPNQPAQYITQRAILKNSIVNEGCMVDGEVRHSVLFYGVEVGEGSVITDSVIMPNVKIGRNVRIHRAIVNENIVIEDNAFIGPEDSSDEIILFDQESQLHARI